MYNTGSNVKLKSSMLRSGFCDYSDAYILVTGTLTVPGVAAGRGITICKKHLKTLLHLLIA